MLKKSHTGKVYLIGGGPGDPGLITVKGKECIEKADVVIYDYLASSTLLNYAEKDAEMLYVGKKSGEHTLSQKKINDLILEKAMEGKIVVRLKGGDPFIFGRGGEEVQELIKSGVDFEIVPGVTSAISAPAYAGIPLTHRKFTSSVSIITGHEDPAKNKSSMDWKNIAKNKGTLVFLMGVKNLPNITKKLIENDKSPQTPIALVHWGTTSRQQTVTGTLETIVGNITKEGLKSPSVIVIGDVVTLRDSMKWFENRPLFGKQIIVTRAREQASDLVKLLYNLGGKCIEFPTIKVTYPKDKSKIDHAIHNLSSYDWIVFTSVNGVSFFFERLFKIGLDVRALSNLSTAAIGPATSKCLLDFGIKSDIIPETYRAESIVDAFKNEKIKNKKILLPRAKEARPVLPVELTKMGAQVDEITTYCTQKVVGISAIVIEQLEKNVIDLVTFTSSSTAKNFRELLPNDKFEKLIKTVTIASIGPITTNTAKELGFNVAIEAESYTIPGLVDAILKYYS